MNNQQKDSMQTNEILQFVEDHDTFLITYYAKKYSKIITRKGTWTNGDKQQIQLDVR
jgi:hypothetical protein